MWMGRRRAVRQRGLCVSVVPCPGEAPTPFGNQTVDYGLVLTNYSCPTGYEFPNGARMMTAECLLATKVWQPSQIPPCQSKQLIQPCHAGPSG